MPTPRRSEPCIAVPTADTPLVLSDLGTQASTSRARRLTPRSTPRRARRERSHATRGTSLQVVAVHSAAQFLAGRPMSAARRLAPKDSPCSRPARVTPQAGWVRFGSTFPAHQRRHRILRVEWASLRHAGGVPISPTFERHRGRQAGWLRAAVLGADDGIVSTASLMLGVAASHASHSAILTAGLAALAAGAMAMAAGEFVSVSSQRDVERADLRTERLEHAANPAGPSSMNSPRSIGLVVSIATWRDRRPEQLSARDAVAAHARDELGQHANSRARPWQAAWVSAASFHVRRDGSPWGVHPRARKRSGRSDCGERTRRAGSARRAWRTGWRCASRQGSVASSLGRRIGYGCHRTRRTSRWIDWHLNATETA